MPAASVLRYIRLCFMDNKYQISKSKEPETKQEMIQHQIEELVKRRDKESDLKAKQVQSSRFTFTLKTKKYSDSQDFGKSGLISKPAKCLRPARLSQPKPMKC